MGRLGFGLKMTLGLFAIVAVSIGAFAGYLRMRDASHQEHCLENLRRIGQAALAYADDHDGHWIPYGTDEGSSGVALSAAEPWKEKVKAYGVSEKHLFCPADPVTNEQKTAAGTWTYSAENLSPGRYQTSYEVHPLTRKFLEEGAWTTSELPKPEITPYAYDGPVRFVTPVDGNPNYTETAHGLNSNVVYLDGHVRTINMHDEPGDFPYKQPK